MRVHTMARELAAGVALGLLLLMVVPPALTQEYALSPGDVLEVSVLGEPEASGSGTVNPDGKITFPLIGGVQASGLTLLQLTQRVTAELKRFIRDPQVTISIRQAAPNRRFAYLIGDVARPGAYEMQPGWTLAELVAVSGGPGPGAALSRVVILRKHAAIPVDLAQLLIEGDASANVALEPGDVVIVPLSKERVAVMGAVAKPGPYLVSPGDRIMDVLSAAGGPTSAAAISNVGVVRQSAGEKPRVVPVDLDKFYKSGDTKQNIPLIPGDIVYVPEKAAGVNWSSLLSNLSILFYLIK